MGSLLPFSVPPRIEEHKHRTTNYVLAFIPERQEWLWTFERVTVMHYSGHCKTIEDAQRAARLHIDLLDGVV